MRAAALWSLLLAVSTVGCARTESPDGVAFVEWVSRRVIVVGDRDANFEWLSDALESARVVGLGESRHDTREQLLFKAGLVRQLIVQLGFRALILEESYPHAMSLDRYVTTGEGDLREIMNGLAGWYLWDTEEMLDVMRWIRQFNEEREPAERVRVFGMDITAPAVGVERVLKSLDAAGVGTRLDARALGLDLQRGDFWSATWERYTALPDQRRAELSKNYDELVEFVAAAEFEIRAASSAQEYERLVRMAEVGRAGNRLFSSADRMAGGVIREAGMARTALWILDREIPGEKAMIWAHNLHVAKGPFHMPEIGERDLEPMGVQLSTALGESYIAIGGTFGAGSYGPDLPPGERLFEPVSVDVMDGALARAGVSSFIVDLRGAESESAAARWLEQRREWRAQDARAVLVPSEAFDLAYFVSRISRSQPTPGALDRYRSLRNQR